MTTPNNHEWNEIQLDEIESMQPERTACDPDGQPANDIVTRPRRDRTGLTANDGGKS
jgi:hypothetical protein